ncbi:MAG: hypothetical protein JJ864_06200 [Rhizobiaceae bacterium]|nr:hypothetical protein [Rhizobiaceae bacterium]
MITDRIAYIALAAAILGVTGAQLLIKARFNALDLNSEMGRGFAGFFLLLLRDWPLWLAAFLMIGGAVLWYVSMIRLPLHFILPCAALISPLASIGAYFLLGEALSGQKVAAIAVIAVGVAWLGAIQA